MLDKSYFGKIVNLFINVFLGIAMVTTALSIAGVLQPMLFFQNVIVSICVGYMICDLIPASAWGERLCNKLAIKNKLLFHLLACAVSGAIYITCISFICQFVAFGGAVFSVWAPMLIYLLLVGYLVLVIFMPLCQKIAGWLTR